MFLREFCEETGCENPQILNVYWNIAWLDTYEAHGKTKKVFFFFAAVPDKVTKFIYALTLQLHHKSYPASYRNLKSLFSGMYFHPPFSYLQFVTWLVDKSRNLESQKF